MKIAFFGSSPFGLPTLERLAHDARHSLVCCITQPDRKKGRGLPLGHTAIKEFGSTAGIPVFQPEDINTGESLEYLASLGADLFIVIAYGQILSEAVLKACALPAINAHASLLPKYRGAAPVHWAVYRGETRTGVTIMKMVKRMDAGPILLQKQMEINPEETAAVLEQRLSLTAADAIQESLALLQKGTCTFREQDPKQATYAPKLRKEHGAIDWERTADEIHNQVRAFCERPGAYTYWHKDTLKLLQAKLCTGNDCPAASAQGVPGEVLAAAKQGIVVSCGKGHLLIERLQPQAKKAMSSAEFLAGHKLRIGDILR